ncbi:Calcineurin-like phosphoesterase superfamily protein [Ruminococcaceae bacterium YRB3002]|nr:Calcineurin-like phosphoesterase superfamily protein [Ruminococcaceae bacterium YRB3002]
MIYFTSDLHLGHRTVLKHRTDFATIDDMNEAFIRDINDTVTGKDTLYILGDLSYRISPEDANDMIRQMNGRKILIRGNHDPEYDPSLFEEIADYLEFKYDHRIYIMMHYPLVCWKQMRHGSVQLHGHIHSSPKYNEHNHGLGRLQYDVGVDANNYRPVSIDEIAAWAASSPWEDYDGINHHAERYED